MILDRLLDSHSIGIVGLSIIGLVASTTPLICYERRRLVSVPVISIIRTWHISSACLVETSIDASTFRDIGISAGSHRTFCRTIASSEQEAASTLALVPETVSRCLLSLTQAFGREARRTTLGSLRSVRPRLAAWPSVSHLLRLGTRAVVTHVVVYGLWSRTGLDGDTQLFSTRVS